VTLADFFADYAARSLGDQPESLAPLYADTFIVAGPEGSHAFPNDEQFIAWLRQVAEFNRDHGMRTMRPVAIREDALSPLHTLATVTWGAQFERTGDAVIEFEIAYLLERRADTWLILAYVSRADQAAAMARLGLA